MFTVFNIHNASLSRGQVREVGQQIEEAMERDKTDPHRSCTFVGGDWNFLAPGDPVWHLGKETPSFLSGER